MAQLATRVWLSSGALPSYADQFCGRWTTNPNYGVTSFDNIVWACNTIFMCISLEGWAQVMYFAQDAVSSWSWVRHSCVLRRSAVSHMCTHPPTPPLVSPVASPACPRPRLRAPQLLFVLMILFGAFILINLMLAVIMTKFREAEEAQHAIAKKRRKRELKFARHLAKSRCVRTHARVALLAV